MTAPETQEDVQDYFVRHAVRFNGLYGGDNMATRIFDRMFRKPMYDRYRFTIEDLKDGQGKRYLDIGCGSGRYAVNLAKLGAKVTGLDFSSDMLNLSRQYAVDEQQEGKVEWVETDMNKWMDGYSGEKYDASYAMGVFDYLTDPVTTLKLMLKCSNRALMSIPAPEFPRAQLRKWRYAKDDCPVFFFKQEDLNKLVSDAGGKIVAQKPLDNSGWWVAVELA